MSFRPTPKQALAIWSMIFGETEAEREPMQSKMRPELKKHEREPLRKAGFIELERRGRAAHVQLTDAAWAWAAVHPDAVLSGSRHAAPVLRQVLQKLMQVLERHDIALAELVTSTDADATLHGFPSARSEAEALGARIRSACLSLADGQTSRRVRLHRLRERLGDVPRERLDDVLLQMQRQGELVLYRLDNPNEMTPADEAAALSIAGNPRHLVYLEA